MVANFQRKLVQKQFYEKCALLGHQLGTTAFCENNRIELLEDRHYLASNDWLTTFLECHRITRNTEWNPYVQWDRKFAKKQIEAVSKKTNVTAILELLKSATKSKENMAANKADLVRAVNDSCFEKIGILLQDSYSYHQLSQGQLKEADAEIFAAFSENAGFKVKFVHVLRCYYYWYDGDTKTVEDEVRRFSLADYQCMMEGENQAKLTESDPDLQDVPFVQMASGTIVYESEHEGGSLTGGYYLLDEMRQISFCSAMIIVKVPSAMQCENN